jgi:hypothetical protein
LNQCLKTGSQAVGGHALICLSIQFTQFIGRRKDQFEILHECSRYADPFELAQTFKLLPRDRDLQLVAQTGFIHEHTRVNMIVCDRFTIKHYLYDQISKEIGVIKQIKLPFEAIACECLVLKASEINEPKGEILVTIIGKQGKTLCAVSGLSHEGKVYYKRTADGSVFHDFTCIAIKQDLVYAGAKNGSVYVFESLSGNFFKEIPFQTAIFAPRRFEDFSPEVTSVKINSQNHLEIEFSDMSCVTLD